jgi:hypothetical protein
MKLWWRCGALCLLWSVAAVQASDVPDGAEILRREERRAQELKDLEYQAQVLERKAKLARMYQELQAQGGFVPDLEFMRMQERLEASQAAGAELRPMQKSESMPVLRRIEGRKAFFETAGGLVSGSAGASIPNGYLVKSVSLDEGVVLEKAGVTYQVDVSWN